MPTIHASAVLVGARAVLIRGTSGSGKSRLALDLIDAAEAGRLPFVRLVADDRVAVEAVHGRLLARAPDAIAGLLEVRGLGLLRMPYEPLAVVGHIVDLGVEPGRLPEAEALRAEIGGVTLPRLAFSSCTAALPVLVAALRVADARSGWPDGA